MLAAKDGSLGGGGEEGAGLLKTLALRAKLDAKALRWADPCPTHKCIPKARNGLRIG